MATIGIDLGTTYSLVSEVSGNDIRIFRNELGEELIPSAVAVAEDGVLLVGRAARDRIISCPGSGVAFFKRDMGTNATYRFAGRKWTPTECSAAVLKELKRIAERERGDTVTDAVVTVPAYFHDSQRYATVEAARIAGLNVRRILNEPTAAALAFGYTYPDKECNLLVFDIGGGTFDVTILEIFEGVIEVRASGGESRLGGEDYTDALAELLAARAPRAAKTDPGRLRQKAEVLKRRLSREPRAALDIDGDKITITRADFLKCTAPLTARLVPVLKRCLRDTGMTGKDLSGVLLVGGASRMSAVRDLVERELGAATDVSLDPDKDIARGAAVQAALVDSGDAVKDIVLTDVSPHTLGIEVAKSMAPRVEKPGYFQPIIERNTIVPVSRVERFSTFHPDQDRVELKVYQGEHRLVKHNTFLGKMRITGLSHAPNTKDGGQVDVRFTYDMNGILEVEATVVRTGRKKAMIIEERPGSLSRKEIAAAMKRLAPLKEHPRDLPMNRARLERSYRLYAELSGEAREHLSFLVDHFEESLESQNRDAVIEAAGTLDAFLNAFYEDEESNPPPGDTAQDAS